MLVSPDSGHENVPIILGSVDLMCYRQSTSVKRTGHAIAQKTKHHQKKDRLAASRPIGEEGVSPSSRIERTKKGKRPKNLRPGSPSSEASFRGSPPEQTALGLLA